MMKEPRVVESGRLKSEFKDAVMRCKRCDCRFLVDSDETERLVREHDIIHKFSCPECDYEIYVEIDVRRVAKDKTYVVRKWEGEMMVDRVRYKEEEE